MRLFLLLINLIMEKRIIRKSTHQPCGDAAVVDTNDVTPKYFCIEKCVFDIKRLGSYTYFFWF